MGDGDRTRMTSLEDWGSAIELHPQATPPWYASLRGVAGSFPSEGLEDYRRIFSQHRRSCRRDSNSQPTAYKAVALPLRHDSIYPSVRKHRCAPTGTFACLAGRELLLSAPPQTCPTGDTERGGLEPPPRKDEGRISNPLQYHYA